MSQTVISTPVINKATSVLSMLASLLAPSGALVFIMVYHHINYDGYPAHSHHDKIPPWWDFVRDDDGGNLSVTKSHHWWWWWWLKVVTLVLVHMPAGHSFFVTSATPIFGQLPPPKFIFDFFQIIFRFEYQTIMLEVVMWWMTSLTRR